MVAPFSRGSLISFMKQLGQHFLNLASDPITAGVWFHHRLLGFA
jgi:hypothetical protein